MIKQVVVLLAAAAAIAARADTLTYLVTVDTSSQLTNPGIIDFQLNAGTVAPIPRVTATIQFFAGPFWTDRTSRQAATRAAVCQELSL